MLAEGLFCAIPLPYTAKLTTFQATSIHGVMW